MGGPVKNSIFAMVNSNDAGGADLQFLVLFVNGNKRYVIAKKIFSACHIVRFGYYIDLAGNTLLTRDRQRCQTQPVETGAYRLLVIILSIVSYTVLHLVIA